MAKSTVTRKPSSTRKSLDARELADLRGPAAAASRSQAIIEFALDGTVLAANENFLKCMGYTRQEIIGRPHSLFVDSAYCDSADYRAFWSRLGRGEFDAGQYRRLAKGGREVWLQASYNPVFDASGRPFKVVKYALDVTEQVRHAQELHLAVEQTRSAVTRAVGGDLAVRIPLGGKSGELAELCAWVNELFDGIERLLQEIMSVVERAEQQARHLSETISRYRIEGDCAVLPAQRKRSAA